MTPRSKYGFEKMSSDNLYSTSTSNRKSDASAIDFRKYKKDRIGELEIEPSKQKYELRSKNQLDTTDIEIENKTIKRKHEMMEKKVKELSIKLFSNLDMYANDIDYDPSDSPLKSLESLLSQNEKFVSMLYEKCSKTDSKDEELKRKIEKLEARSEMYEDEYKKLKGVHSEFKNKVNAMIRGFSKSK